MAAWRRLALLAAALAAALASPAPDWRRSAVVYRVDVRLFRDGDGDGVGDLAGAAEGLRPLAEMGVDAVWLSPVFPGAAEHLAGRGVANYTAVDPAFGDLDDLQSLLETAAALGVKVLLEFVPNHTSDSHAWFELSAARREPYSDYYVWEDGAGSGEQAPPNDWESVTGGSAWSWNEQRGQFFLHQFGETQPDLNYRSEHVRREMEEALLFWLRRGLSGFVLAGVSHLYESDEEPPGHGGTLDLPETYRQVRRWRQLLDEFGERDNRTRLLAVESRSGLQSVLRYYGSEDEPAADMPLNFPFLSALRLNGSSQELAAAVGDWLAGVPAGSAANWMVGSSTLNEMASCFSAHEVDALNAVLQVLPGSVVVYDGDSEAWREPAAAGDEDYPLLPWDLSQPLGGAASGSNDSATRLLPPSSGPAEEGIGPELEDVHSRLLRKMSLRRTIPTLQSGDVHVSAVAPDTLLLARTLEGWDAYVAVVNFGDSSTTLNMSSLFYDVASVVVHSCSSNSGLREGEIISSLEVTLPPRASVVLRLSQTPPGGTETSTEDPDMQSELFLRDRDNSTLQPQIFENGTEASTADVTNFTEADGYETTQTSTDTTDIGAEVFAQTLSSTETASVVRGNSTETGEVENGSAETYADTAGVENSTEISTVAMEPYPSKPLRNPFMPEAPCFLCEDAQKQTEPTTIPTTTTNGAGESWTSHFSLIPALILISAAVL
ncbi:maltase A3-like [Bacillus rossius redtenbacheri]|uniref:maltase A3-like n=1 Tax=Bacillus rossius redtenbacheri TaxID=93214 RepID=UPI002FDE45DB